LEGGAKRKEAKIGRKDVFNKLLWGENSGTKTTMMLKGKTTRLDKSWGFELGKKESKQVQTQKNGKDSLRKTSGLRSCRERRGLRIERSQKGVKGERNRKRRYKERKASPESRIL